MHINDILDSDLLGEMLRKGYVKRTVDNDGFAVYNYTALAQYSSCWNEVTRTCRGLITNKEGEVIARGFRKFFNYGQETVSEHGPVHVTEKLDGSLGIAYPRGGVQAIATRGSFTSEQSVHANSLWQANYASKVKLNPAWTYLFEIIYPLNRIVCNYNTLDDLVLLGALNTATGRSVALDEARVSWPGPVVEEHPYKQFRDVLTLGERAGKEGVVVHFLESDERVKIKHVEYKRLHQIVTGTNELSVWKLLSGKESYDFNSWLEGVPDEIYNKVRVLVEDLEARHRLLMTKYSREYSELRTTLGEGFTRAEFARAVEASHVGNKSVLFSILDGKDPSDAAWRAIRPNGDNPAPTDR